MKEKSIIHQIFNGDISYSNYKRTGEEEKLLDRIIKYDDEIRKKLSVSAELSELYEKTNDAIKDYHYVREDVYFEQGFKFGFRLCLEILNEDGIKE